MPFSEVKYLEVPGGDDVPLCSLCKAPVYPMERNLNIEIGDLDKNAITPWPVRALLCKACIDTASNRHTLFALKENTRVALQTLEPADHPSHDEMIAELRKNMGVLANLIRHVQVTDPELAKLLRRTITDTSAAIEVMSVPECYTEECEVTDCALCTSPRRTNEALPKAPTCKCGRPADVKVSGELPMCARCANGDE